MKKEILSIQWVRISFLISGLFCNNLDENESK